VSDMENTLRFIIKLLAAMSVIVFCTQIGRKLPTLGGLIAVMPLTGLIVLVWLSVDNPGDYRLMAEYTRAALWGICPSVLFFLVAYSCFKKAFSLPVVLAFGCAAWLIAAFIHQWLINK